MAAVLSSDMDNTDKVVPLIEECRRMGLVIKPPDVNASYLNSQSRLARSSMALERLKGSARADYTIGCRSESGWTIYRFA